MDEDTFKMLLQESEVCVVEGNTMDEKLHAFLVEMYEKSISERDAALRILHSLPDLPDAFLAMHQLPNQRFTTEIPPDEEDIKSTGRFISESDQVQAGNGEKLKRIQGPSVIEGEICRTYKSPLHLEGVLWTKGVANIYMVRIAPHPPFNNQENSYSLDFEVCNIYSTNSGDDYDLVAEGNLKWDGCMNVCFYRNYQHFCGPEDVEEFQKVLKWIWTQGKTLETWDSLLDY